MSKCRLQNRNQWQNENIDKLQSSPCPTCRQYKLKKIRSTGSNSTNVDCNISPVSQGSVCAAMNREGFVMFPISYSTYVFLYQHPPRRGNHRKLFFPEDATMTCDFWKLWMDYHFPSCQSALKLGLIKCLPNLTRYFQLRKCKQPIFPIVIKMQQ